MKYYAFNGKSGMKVFRCLSKAVKSAKTIKHSAPIIYSLFPEQLNVRQLGDWSHFVKYGEIAWVRHQESAIEHPERFDGQS